MQNCELCSGKGYLFLIDIFGQDNDEYPCPACEENDLEVDEYVEQQQLND